jgi:hypothetical protein
LALTTVLLVLILLLVGTVRRHTATTVEKLPNAAPRWLVVVHVLMRSADVVVRVVLLTRADIAEAVARLQHRLTSIVGHAV